MQNIKIKTCVHDIIKTFHSDSFLLNGIFLTRFLFTIKSDTHTHTHTKPNQNQSGRLNTILTKKNHQKTPYIVNDGMKKVCRKL